MSFTSGGAIELGQHLFKLATNGGYFHMVIYRFLLLIEIHIVLLLKDLDLVLLIKALYLVLILVLLLKDLYLVLLLIELDLSLDLSQTLKTYFTILTPVLQHN